MGREAVAIAAAIVLAAVACADDSPSLSVWCGLVADGALVTLDAPDAPGRWAELEEAAPVDLRDDVERLRVAADQVAGVDSDDLTSAARLVVTPLVLDAHRRVVLEVGSRCRIDVSNLTVIDQR